MDSIIFKNNLSEALIDYKYLLNRKYPYKPSLDLVAQRYGLSKPEKALLYRCVHDEETANSIRKKLVRENSVRNSLLIIDGFNVIITISSALECYQVFLCDDGVLRDIMKSFKKFRFEDKHVKVVEILLKEIKELKPSKVLMFFDKQVSFSGKVSTIIANLASEYGLSSFETMLVSRNDTKVIEYAGKGVVSSSDIVILLKAPRIFDIAHYVIRKYFPKKIVNINKILNRETAMLKK